MFGLTPVSKTYTATVTSCCSAERLPAGYAQEVIMLDVVVLGLGLGFFALTLGYAYACERL